MSKAISQRKISALLVSSIFVGLFAPSASANAIGLVFPSGTNAFVVNEFQSVSSVTGTTPAITGGTAGAEFRVSVSASNYGLLRMAVTDSIAAAPAFTLSNFDDQSAGLSVISFIGERDKVSDALASLEFKKAAAGDSSIAVSVTEETGIVAADSFGIGVAFGDSYYEAYNSGGKTWEETAKLALSRSVPSTVDGISCQGYLLNITSKQEQEQIQTKMIYQSFMGGSDSLGFVNDSIDFINNADNGNSAYSTQDFFTIFSGGVWNTSGNNLTFDVPVESANLELGEMVNVSGASTANLEGAYRVVFSGLSGPNQSLNSYTLEATNITDDTQADVTGVSGSLIVDKSLSTEGKFHWVFGPERGQQISLDNGNAQVGEPLNLGDSDFPGGYPESGQTNNGFLVGRDINAGLTSGADSNLRVGPASDHVFQNWNSKEPNDDASGEDFLQILPGGLWNDRPANHTLNPFIVEYGGLRTGTGFTTTAADVTLSDLTEVGDVASCVPAVAASTKTASFTANVGTAPEPTQAAPYYGPISRPLARTEVIAGEEATIRGFRLDVVEKVTVGNQDLEIVSQNSSELVIVVATELSGMVALSLHWRNGKRTGIYRIPEALNVLPAEIATEPIQTEQSDSKVNAGSFKGYVAVYAKGHEGKRLSAKIGKDWVIVDPIVNNESESLFRVTDFTGAGVDIQVRIFIDRELLATIPLTTR